MRALFLEAPEDILEYRRITGADRLDEMWDGVLHMPPEPTYEHQRFGTRFIWIVLPRARARGLEVVYETALHKSANDYRKPDVVVARPENCVKRGIEGGAELAVEILSPDDESYEKMDWYAEFGVKELLIVDPGSRKFELFRLRGKAYRKVRPGRQGRVTGQALDVIFATVPGPRFEIAWQGGAEKI